MSQSQTLFFRQSAPPSLLYIMCDLSPVSVRFNSINEEDVLQYLNANPDTIAHYVKEYIDVPTIKVREKSMVGKFILSKC